MNELMVLRGLPGSGKSALARDLVNKDGYARLNRDDLRASIFGEEGVLSYDKETVITEIEKFTARTLLTHGFNVVVDNMNLRNKYVAEWEKLARNLGSEFSVWPLHTSVEACVDRDQQRGRRVGESVIRELAAKFYDKNGRIKAYAPPAPEISVQKRVPYEPIWNVSPTPWATIVDLDGTIALNHSGRSPYDWHRVGEDHVNHDIEQFIIEWGGGYFHGDGDRRTVLFVSGRDGVCYSETYTWLEDNFGPSGDFFNWELHMRPEGDTRKDSIVKYEIFDEKIRGRFNVRAVFDDRNSVVEMWREIGLTCLQVAPGGF